MVRKVMMMAALALALGLTHGAAVARWRAPVAVPVWPGAPQQPVPLAVADDGRAAVISNNILRADLFVVTPEGGTTTTSVPGLQAPTALAFAPDGTIIGLGRSFSFEQEADAAGKRRGCCERPTLMHWRPGAPAPQLTVVQHPFHTNYTAGSLMVDRRGDASFISVEDQDVLAEAYGEKPRDPVVVATRVSADGGSIAQKTLPAGPTPAGDRRGFALDPRGRRVSVVLRNARVLLQVAGRRTLTLQRLRRPARATTRLAVGTDGTVAVLVVDNARLVLHKIDAHARRRSTTVLGAVRPDPPSGFGVGPQVAVDAKGHAHVSFNPPGGGAVVVGPHGRHRLPGFANGLAVSPGGATAVELRDGGTTLVAVDTRD